ncbi:MAG: hypothetical protein OSA89_04165 [Mariniblastus sp.]|nr:hypothetical protein [Mariniblastus sp.]
MRISTLLLEGEVLVTVGVGVGVGVAILFCPELLPAIASTGLFASAKAVFTTLFDEVVVAI